ncbi:MAG: hypothetical protein PHH04_05675 [Thomasclavelia sp.]|jgi:hypothetical protein|nr:hypothetical protein [Thomasclavelia sp.]
MKLEVNIHGKKEKLDKEEIQEHVVAFYDAAGIKSMHLDIDELSDKELVELFNNSFAK